MSALRLLYAAGPGDVVMSFENWRSGKEVVSETARTFSGALFDFCRSRGARAFVLSSHPRKARIRDGDFVVENRPKSDPGGQGLDYHRSQIRYGLTIVREALRFRADVVVVDSGTTHWFVLSLLKPLGIRAVVSLHNALWPKGYFPAGRVKRAILALDGLFWRHAASATIAVSPELGRQVAELAGGRPHGPVVQMRGMYRRELMSAVAAPPAADVRPFRIMYAGRIERDKGVLDLVEIAERVRSRHPGQAVWEVCGDGGALAELREKVAQRKLEDTVRVLGRLNRFDMAQCYGRAHAVIVPTRSEFREGLPLVAIEGVLSGRPVITSRLSNALDVLGPAIVEAQPDDVDSYVAAAERLLTEPGLYARLREGCGPLQEQFYDPANSFASALARAIPESRK